MGINVFIEKGVGELSSYSDKDYSSLGAKICKNSTELYKNSNLIKINRPTIKGKINEFSKINEKFTYCFIIQTSLKKNIRC